jgi:two-component system, cell cycle sensor histidine kinase and response regulator CckA
MLDAVPVPLAAVDCGTRVVYVNEAFRESLVPDTSKDIVGKPLFDVIAIGDEDRMQSDLNAASADGRGFTSDYAITTVEDGKRWFEIAYKRVRHDAIDAILLTMTDITNRKEIERELSKEKDLLRSLMDSIPDSIYFKDTRSRFTRINEAQAKLLGAAAPDDAVGKTDFDYFSREHATEAYDDERNIMNGGAPVVNKIEHIEREDGWVWKTATKVPIRMPDGAIAGIVGITRDITDLKNAENERERLGRLLKETQEISKVGGWEYDIRSDSLTFTDETYRIYGDARSADLSDHTFHLRHYTPASGEKIIGAFRRAIEDGEPFDMELEFIRSDEKKLWVRTVGKPVYENGERVRLIGNILDITERKDLERQIIHKQRLESIGTLASGVAHDFNNILTIILGYCRLLEDSRDKPDEFKENIEVIVQSVRRGSNLVQQILAFARQSDSVVQISDINEIIGEVTGIVRNTFPKSISLENELKEDLPVLCIDRSQILQALLNICINARDAIIASYLSKGTIVIRSGCVRGTDVKDTFPDASSEKYIHISISDTGTGIAPADRDYIFDPFYTTKDPDKGTGLGLSFVYGVLQNCRGFIDFTTEVGSGTTFDLFLPVSETTGGNQSAEVRPDNFDISGSETILVVEDEEMLLSVVVHLLESQGYTVMSTRDGAEALEIFRRNRGTIALVLTDIGLPEKSGVELVGELVDIDPGTRIVAASGYIDPATAVALRAKGVMDIIGKPYDAIEVLQKVREALDAPALISDT